ncbi:putative Adenylate kinase [Rhodotorula taiwanensis]|uniref:Putative Adenylate kinase n=1 Tax=Rhodotorula taiwanensis TaxID=741276 RepID=A0A2S5B0C1_9BASI|nr:putative Adenylate kinase [Rhodotorula taiwanensis]
MLSIARGAACVPRLARSPTPVPGPTRLARRQYLATAASVAVEGTRGSRKLRMILLGAPGAGKGTLSDWLLQRYDIDTIVVGQLLRNEIVKGSELGLQAERTMRAGGLLADEVVLQVVEPALKAMKDKDWILDGFPRKASQAVLLDKMLAETGDSLNFVGSLKVPDEVIIERIADRYIHLSSGRTYNLRFNPPKVAGKDDVTGEPLSQRPDDDPLVVRKRLEGFHEENDPLLAHYGREVHAFEGRTSKEIWPHLVDALAREFPDLPPKE